MKQYLIDHDELTVRLIEACFSVTRPEGATIEETLEHVDAKTLEQFRRIAHVAVAYIAAQCKVDLQVVIQPAGVM